MIERKFNTFDDARRAAEFLAKQSYMDVAVYVDPASRDNWTIRSIQFFTMKRVLDGSQPIGIMPDGGAYSLITMVTAETHDDQA